MSDIRGKKTFYDTFKLDKILKMYEQETSLEFCCCCEDTVSNGCFGTSNIVLSSSYDCLRHILW